MRSLLIRSGLWVTSSAKCKLLVTTVNAGYKHTRCRNISKGFPYQVVEMPATSRLYVTHSCVGRTAKVFCAVACRRHRHVLVLGLNAGKRYLLVHAPSLGGHTPSRGILVTD